MQPIKSISIPKPCHESWNQMTANEQGRYCGQCCKTVTDFSVMTNAEIIKHLASTHNVCGRFDERQLNSLNHQLYAENLKAHGWWKKMALTVSLLSTTLSFKASAQTKPAVEQGPKPQQAADPGVMMLGKIAAPETPQYRIIKGQVTAADNGLAIPGAVIKVPRADINTITDVNGNFNLRVPIAVAQFTVSFVGYNPQTVNVSMASYADYALKLTPQNNVMGGAFVTVTYQRPALIKRVYYKFIRQPIRKIFN